MGDHAHTRAEEIATLQRGLDLGATLIDTAEMYGEGDAEALIGAALAGRREEAFIVSKVYPHNASRRAMASACERSLRRLKTDRLDLYLLHWSGSVPLAETVEAFTALQKAGKIRHWGVSNLDLKAMKALTSLSGGGAVQTDQVLYNLSRRGIEWDLLPWLRKRKTPVMAYSPFEEGRLLRDPRLVDFARRYSMTPAQVALAWLLAADDVIVIPKAATRAHLEHNMAAADIRLTDAQRSELDGLFAPPSGARALEML
jgi:diketogulonate reductase-like aldo/keto reductase